MSTANKKNGIGENKILHDLEDYVDATQPDFMLVGEGDIERISSILGQSQNNNMIYIGRSGLGKSANLYGIARKKIAGIEGTLGPDEQRLPLHMIDRRYLLLDTNTLFDSNDPETIQGHIRKIFAELDKPGDHVLIIEDANDWLRGIDDNQCQGMISAFVRELKKGTFQAVLMVRDTPGKNNLGQVLGCHSEMTELFTILEKQRPSQEKTLEILRRSKHLLEQHHDGLHITDAANDEIVKLTFLYPNLSIYMREQPARSLKIRDRIASTFVSRMQTRPPELAALEDQLTVLDETIATDAENPELITQKAELELNIESVRSVWEQRALELGKAYMAKRKLETDIEGFHVKLETLNRNLHAQLEEELQRAPTDKDISMRKTQEIKELESFIRAARKELEEAVEHAQALKGEHNEQLTLGVSDVREFFSELSGIPTKDLNADEATKVLGLDNRLKERIYGQDDVVDTVAGAIRRAKAGLKDPKQPIGSFVMIGSSGIGKTYTAECLAQDLYDDADALTVFDMSEFMERQNLSRLIGSTPGLVGYGEGGALTNAVRKRPYQVILFDEAEKAHPDVFKILLQVLDKGRLSDELGTVDFRNTVILMTTNMGHHLSFDEERTSKNSRADIIHEIRKIFPQELINRVDDFMLFKALKDEHIRRILERELADLNKKLAEKSIGVELPDSDIHEIVSRKYQPEEGARQVQKFLNNNMVDQVAEIVLQNSHSGRGGLIQARFNPEEDGFELSFVASEDDTPSPGAELRNSEVAGAFLAGAGRPGGAVFAPSIH